MSWQRCCPIKVSSFEIGSIVQAHNPMKHYPLGIDNPIKVKGVFGSHKWAIYWADDMTKIATFNSQFQAYQARQYIIESL